MEAVDVFDLIERMAALIRSEERKKCAEFGLQPVHLQVLDYLSRCNRYSDTPAALTNYLGMTRELWFEKAAPASAERGAGEWLVIACAAGVLLLGGAPWLMANVGGALAK